MITPDLIFSYWIFAWYILYILKLIHYSPKIWVIIALFYILFIIIYMIYKKKIYFTLLFSIMTIITKVIPLYTIRNDKYNIKDFIFGILLFIIYLCWVFYRKKNVINIYKGIINSDINMTPGIYLINKYILNIKN